MKKILFIIGTIVMIIIVYVSYVFIAYYRLEDYINIEIIDKNNQSINKNKEYSMITYNIGMGIYSQDFGFFMDGGNKGRANDIETVNNNNSGIINTIKNYNPDFIIIEETAVDCTCSYHVNELSLLEKNFNQYDISFAQNWDSPYLSAPLIKPFGKAKTGLTTLSSYNIETSTRISLPIEEKITKIIDLDRCYSKSTISINNDDDSKLILYVIHASAYTTDGITANRQIEMLIKDMKEEYDKGNYVIAGGDWNRDLYGDTWKYFIDKKPEYEWTRNLDKTVIPNNFYIADCIDKNNPIPSVRNADGPYNKEQVQLVVDGFILSDNIVLKEAKIIDTQFKYSDHNPVYISFYFR